MKIGITGSRDGTTNEQLSLIAKFLSERDEGAEVHHGDCVGADMQVHHLAVSESMRIVVHPPNINALRAYCKGDETREPLPYLDRNRKIVDECDILLVIPDGPERLRSGTWSTVRYARRIHKPAHFIYPDGTEIFEDNQ